MGKRIQVAKGKDKKTFCHLYLKGKERQKKFAFRPSAIEAASGNRNLSKQVPVVGERRKAKIMKRHMKKKIALPTHTKGQGS